MQASSPTLFWILTFHAMVVGCAATPGIMQVHPIETNVENYTTAQIIVDGSAHIRDHTGYESTVTALTEEMIENLEELNIFHSVGVHDQSGKVLEVHLLITDLNYVHGAARGLTGIMAGRAVLSVTMKLKDKESGKVLGILTANDASHHGQGLLSPTTGRQVSAIAREFSERLAKR